MKIKVNDNEYQLAKSGISVYDNKLVLTIVRNTNTFEEIQEIADNDGIAVLKDDNSYISVYKGYTIYVEAYQKEIVLNAAKYDDEGVITQEEEKGIVVVLVLGKDGSYTEPTKDKDTEDVTTTVEEHTAQIEYLLMMIE
jgi:hypothetical protein